MSATLPEPWQTTHASTLAKPKLRSPVPVTVAVEAFVTTVPPLSCMCETATLLSWQPKQADESGDDTKLSVR